MGRLRRGRGVVLLAGCSALVVLAGLVPATTASAAPDVAVIVTGASTGDAAAALTRWGGDVTRSLDLVAGVAGEIPASALPGLTSDPAVSTSPDVALHVTGVGYAQKGKGRDGGLGVEGSQDPPALPVQLAAVNLGDTWSTAAGSGVSIALVDTGVAPGPVLPAERIVVGPDISGENDGIDHHGHGTFMAGLMVGGSADQPLGLAPGAKVVAVKVAGADGTTSMSKVIAGIAWAVGNRAAYGIRVLNLSLAVDAPVPYLANPLSVAVEAAWSAGVTVVVPAGNEGAGHVSSPGDDPWVLTVGAADTRATVDRSDDVVPAWSSVERFHGYAKPDLVAPGVSVLSARAAGSTIDTANPSARVGDGLFRGSGTSMSTGLTSAAAAIVTAAHPAWVPNQVRSALQGGSRTGPIGELDVAAALSANPSGSDIPSYKAAFGGMAKKVLPVWDGTNWAGTNWAGTNWAGTNWAGTNWAGTNWAGTNWAGTNWAAQGWR
jgi:serine protease AprX